MFDESFSNLTKKLNGENGWLADFCSNEITKLDHPNLRRSDHEKAELHPSEFDEKN